MDARDAAVERLVPHRGAMSWLDRVIHCDADGVIAEATIRAAPFVSPVSIAT